MRDPMPEDEDQRLRLLFGAAAAPVADEGFSGAVMKRVALLAWRRRLVIAAAGTAGFLVAARPLWDFSVALSRELALAGERWTEFAWLLRSPWLAAAALVLVAAPAIWQWIEE